LHNNKSITINITFQCRYLIKSKVLKNLIGDKDPIPEENIGDLILNAFKSKPNFIGQVMFSNNKNYFAIRTNK